MSSNYLPSSGNVQVVDGFTTVKKYPLPLVPRAFPSGTPLWNNGAGGVEPALLSTINAGSVATAATSAASTYADAAAANAVFAPLFAGFALEGRVPQSFAPMGQFSNAGDAAAVLQDASTPFIPVAAEGIAVAPCAALGAQHEIGELVSLAGFVNEATTGFYDAAGALQKDTKAYLYNNLVQIETAAANAIGVLTERALAGQTYLRFQFQARVTDLAAVVALAAD